MQLGDRYVDRLEEYHIERVYLVINAGQCLSRNIIGEHNNGLALKPVEYQRGLQRSIPAHRHRRSSNKKRHKICSGSDASDEESCSETDKHVRHKVFLNPHIGQVILDTNLANKRVALSLRNPTRTKKNLFHLYSKIRPA